MTIAQRTPSGIAASQREGLIEVRGLTKQFSGVDVYRNFDLTLREG